MKITVLSGPSGSGISSSRYVFEELGYYICENFPIESLPSVIQSFYLPKYEDYSDFCLIVPISSFKDAVEYLRQLTGVEITSILLLIDENTLMERYRLSRHAHPLERIEGLTVDEAIHKEVEIADDLRYLADFSIDTSPITAPELRKALSDIIVGRERHRMQVHFVSFGLKRGQPRDLDMLLDVRLIPNPYWIEYLKELDGTDQPVIDYINSFEVTHQLLKQMTDYLDYVLPLMKKEGRASYTIGIACTGGQHRSPYVAEYLANYYKKGYRTTVYHRDIYKESGKKKK